MVLERFRCWIAVAVSVLAAAGVAVADTPCPALQIAAPDPVSSAYFGWAVDTDGDRLLVGARGIGRAYVFRRVVGTWALEQRLMPSHITGGDEFGGQVSIDGHWAFVTSPGHIHLPGASGGTIFVYRFNGTQWIEWQELWVTGRGPGGGLGFSIDINGSVAVTGVPFDDDLGLSSGSAYIFRLDPLSGFWVQEQKLLPSDGMKGDFFGHAVAIQGDAVLIGAPTNLGTGLFSGAVYVFHRNPITSQWMQFQKFMPTQLIFAGLFGESLAMSGDMAIIGAQSAATGGRAYIFRREPRTKLWQQQQLLSSPSPATDSQFGFRVDLDGDWAIIADNGSSQAAPGHGAAHLFRFNGTQWVPHQDLLPPVSTPISPLFGFDVAISGNTAIVGALGGAGQHGSAFLYVVNHVAPDLNCDAVVNGIDLALLLGSWGPVAAGVKPTPTPAADLNGDGVVNGLDLALLLDAWG